MTRVAPTMGIATPGMYETAAWWNANVKALGDWTLAPPIFSAIQITSQSIPNGATGAAITWDTEKIDSEGGHSTTTNPQLYTFQAAGTFLIMTNGTFATNSTGVRSTKLMLNGTVIQGSQTTVPTSPSTQITVPAFAVVPAVAGDTIAVQLTHTVASAINTYNGSDVCPTIAIIWVSR